MGHAAFYGIGAYTSAYVTKLLLHRERYFLYPCVNPMWDCFRIYWLSYWHTYLKAQDDFLAIATLGFGTLVRVFLDNSDKFAESLGGSKSCRHPRITNLELVFFSIYLLSLITKTSSIPVTGSSESALRMMSLLPHQ